MRCGRQGLNPAALPDTPNPSGSHKRAVSPVTVWTEPFRGREGSSRDQEQRPSARFFCPPQALPFPSWPGRGHDTVQFQSGKGTWRAPGRMDVEGRHTLSATRAIFCGQNYGDERMYCPRSLGWWRLSTSLTCMARRRGADALCACPELPGTRSSRKRGCRLPACIPDTRGLLPARARGSWEPWALRLLGAMRVDGNVPAPMLLSRVAAYRAPAILPSPGGQSSLRAPRQARRGPLFWLRSRPMLLPTSLPLLPRITSQINH